MEIAVGILVTVVGGLIVLVIQRRMERRRSGPSPVAEDAPPDLPPGTPEPTDQELLILREMEKYGGRAWLGHIPLRGGSGKTGAIFIGENPVDSSESGWVYSAITGSLEAKGFIEVQGNDYRLTDHGRRVLTAHRSREIRPLPPIIDALTGQPRL